MVAPTTLNQIQTDAQGNKLYASGSNIVPTTTPGINASTPFPVAQIGGNTATASAIPTAPVTDYKSPLGSAMSSLPNALGADASYGQRVDSYKKSMGITDTRAPQSVVDTYNNEKNTLGIDQKQQTVNDLTAKLSAINAEAGATSLTEGGQFSTKAVSGAVQSQIERERAIRALPVSAELQAAQGNLTAANNQLTTLVQLVQKDIDNKYQYQKDQINYAMQYADADQKAALQKQADALEAKKEANQNLTTLKQTFIEAAIKAGDYKTAGALAAATDTATLQSLGGKIGGGTSSSGTLQQANSQSNIKNIDDVLKNPALSSAVGTSFITRAPTGFLGTLGAVASLIGIPSVLKGTYEKLTGNQQNFIAGVSQLQNQLSLDSLIQAKAKGATFGALSEGELNLLSQSATKLNSWAQKDSNGNVTGYNASEKDFKAELDKINNFAKLDYLLKGGKPEDVGAQTMPDGSVVVKNSDGTFTQIK